MPLFESKVDAAWLDKEWAISLLQAELDKERREWEWAERRADAIREEEELKFHKDMKYHWDLNEYWDEYDNHEVTNQTISDLQDDNRNSQG